MSLSGENFLVWLFIVRKAQFGLNFTCLKTEKRGAIIEILHGVSVVSFDSMAWIYSQISF